MRWMLRAKLHRVRVTGRALHYEGSLTLDPLLMEAADILPFERVEVYDIHNGNRFSTYVIPGDRGSGQVVVNGAAARLVEEGDLLIVAVYGLYGEEEARRLRPKVIFVDKHNRVKGGTSHGPQQPI